MRRLVILLLACATAFAAASERHHFRPQPVTPQPVAPPPAPEAPVPGGSDSHSDAALVAFAIAVGICVYHKCWRSPPVADKEPTRITPDLPRAGLLGRQ